MHPGTLGAVRRLRDQNKRLQLELIQGAGSIDGTSEQETLWGVRVVQTTQQAAGTAAVLSVNSGAAVVYVREAPPRSSTRTARPRRTSTSTSQKPGSHWPHLGPALST
jgi:hypothetical protein